MKGQARKRTEAARPDTRPAPQIGEDLRFQRRDWRTQRVAWCAIAVLIVAALAGLFGSGPLSHARATGDGLEIEYDRFVRRGANTELRIRATARGPTRVAVARSYLDAFRLQQLVPQPAEVQSAGDRLVFVFAGTGDGRVAATFELRPSRLWSHTAWIALDGGRPVAVRQFAYP